MYLSHRLRSYLYRRLLRRARETRQTRNALAAALWDRGCTRARLDEADRRVGRLEAYVRSLHAAANLSASATSDMLLDLNGRAEEIERRLGMPGRVQLELDLTSLGKG